MSWWANIRHALRPLGVLLVAAVIAFANLSPAAAVAPIGNSTFLQQTQTQNLSGINGANTNAYTAQSVSLNGKVYFIGNSPTTGPELYSTDGTPSGTNLVKDLYAGGTGYANLLAQSDRLQLHRLEHSCEWHRNALCHRH